MPDREPVSDAQDLDLRSLGRGALAIVAAILFAVAAAFASWTWLGAGPGANRGPAGAQAALPRLLTAPQPDRAAYVAEKQRVLDSYGWVDRDAGIARIPVEQAMQLAAERARAARATP